jgi:Ca2+-binding RTX toxin-like protein
MNRRNRTVVVLSCALLGALAVGPEVAQAAPRCFGKAATIVGTNARNRIRGTAGRDVVVGLGGNDIIVGLGGPDLLCGNGGNDTVAGDAGNDKVSGSAGLDLLYGGVGGDVLTGGNGFDAILANAGNDRLFGQGGQDELFGQPGRDLINGGPNPFDIAAYLFANGVNANLATRRATGDGVDRLRSIEILEGSRGNDTFIGTAGDNYFWDFRADVYRGRGGFDLVSFFRSPNPIDANTATDIATGQGSDTLTDIEDVAGSDQPDTLTGDPGSNQLIGFRGGDTLTADDGDDFLFGDQGTDTGDGGPGQDRCEGIENQSNCEMRRVAAARVRPPAGAVLGMAPAVRLGPERPALG